MKGRKNGCPVNIRDWIVRIKGANDAAFTRVYGLNSMTRSVDSSTEDGSADSDTWEENYIKKRSGSVSLEGKPVVVASTGAKDEGQAILDEYAELTGCDADVTVELVDPYGHAVQFDGIVTSRQEKADDSGVTVSWDIDQVGEPETVPYVGVTSIALKNDGSAVTTLSIEVGDPAEVITVDFTPATASNKRFKVSNSARNVAAISNITETGFSVTGIAAGSATITVTTVNGGKTATLALTVT